MTGRLPAAVNATGISISKANSNFVFGAGFLRVMVATITDSVLELFSTSMESAIERLPGVGDVNIFGERRSSLCACGSTR